MRPLLSVILFVVVLMMIFGTTGCEDEVKVQRSYEGSAPPPRKQAEQGKTVYQRNVQIESEGFDDADDDEEVMIQRSSETSTQEQEMMITP